MSSPASNPAAEVDRDLVEWNYGDYEGKRSAEILKERPDWQLFRDGCPGGESPPQIGERADRVVRRVRCGSGKHADFFQRPFPAGVRRALAGPRADRGPVFLLLTTASVSALGYEHDLSEPVIRLWNDTRHVEDNMVTFLVLSSSR